MRKHNDIPVMEPRFKAHAAASICHAFKVASIEAGKNEHGLACIDFGKENNHKIKAAGILNGFNGRTGYFLRVHAADKPEQLAQAAMLVYLAIQPDTAPEDFQTRGDNALNFMLHNIQNHKANEWRALAPAIKNQAAIHAGNRLSALAAWAETTQTKRPSALALDTEQGPVRSFLNRMGLRF